MAGPRIPMAKTKQGRAEQGMAGDAAWH